MKKKKKQKKTWELHRHGKKWTSEEEDLLKNLYPDVFNHELVECFGRTQNAIRSKSSKLEIRKNWKKYVQTPKGKRWSKREIKRLKKLYPVMPTPQLLEHFPKRNKATIMSKANLLGLKKDYITHFVRTDNYERKLWYKQKERLKKLYPLMNNRELAEKFGCTESAVRGTAWKLGLHKAGFRPGGQNEKGARVWTLEEDILIRKLYPTIRTKDLAARLNRNAKAVRGRATVLGIRKDPKFSPFAKKDAWTVQDTEKLRRLRQQGRTMAQIAEAIGRTVSSVGHQIEKLGLPRKSMPKSWSREDEEYLVQHYHKTFRKQIAASLGRTLHAIAARATILKITKPELNRWALKDIKKLRQLWQAGHTMAQIAKVTGKTITSIANQVRRQKQDFGLPEKPYRPKWSEKDTAYLIQHYKTTPIPQLGDVLGRTQEAITKKARKLELVEFVSKPWTAEEIDMLKEYYPQWPVEKVVRKLGKTRSAVLTKAQRMGFRAPKLWTGEEIDILKKYYNMISDEEIAKKLGYRTPIAVHGKAIKLGLRE